MRPRLGLNTVFWLERVGVALLLVAALVPRVRDFTAPFDREIEGWQGAFFAIAAVNYERMGVDAAGGYPVVAIDTMREAEGLGGTHIRIPREQWLVYANHPPVVPLIAWASLVVFGPEHWERAWLEDRAPDGIEPVIRLPFLLFHLLFLWGLWWAVRQARGAGTAMVALALAAFTPVLVIYGSLVNYENPSLPLIVLAAGFHSRWMRDGQRGDLFQFSLCLGLGCAVTWAPLMFLPAFVLAAFGVGKFGRGGAELLSGGLACLLAVAGQAFWSGRALESVGQPAASALVRARELLTPMFDGSLPILEWLGLQGTRAAHWFTLPLLAAALIGVVLLLRAAARPLPPRQRGRTPLDIGFPLLLGGLFVLLGFYRHTFDAQHSFMMYAAPGIVVLAATAIEAVARPLARLRAGIAPVVVLVGSLGLFATQRFNAIRYELRARDASESALALPAPALPLPDVTGRELASVLPAGSLGLYPSEMGLNLAVSFYAWRSLWPVTGPDDRDWRAVAARFGLDEAPVFLLLPREPPGGARAQVQALRASAPGAGSAPGPETEPVLEPAAEDRLGSEPGSWTALPLGG